MQKFNSTTRLCDLRIFSHLFPLCDDMFGDNLTFLYASFSYVLLKYGNKLLVLVVKKLGEEI